MTISDSSAANRRFFGLDFSGSGWRSFVERLSAAPLFAWLSPASVVRVWCADGRVIDWSVTGTQPVDAAARQRAPAFVAVEVPETIVLRRSLALPAALPHADVERAVALDVQGASPFAPEDLVWGHVAPPAGSRGVQSVEIVLASRRQVQQHLGAATAPWPVDMPAEAWAWSAGGHPVVVSGFGEGRRLQNQGARRRVLLLLLLLALALLAAIAITPTAQLRLRAIAAVHSYDAVVQKAQPLIQKREALTRTTQQLEALEQAAADRVDPLAIMDLLTRVIPDDTYLQSMNLQGNKVTISGQTANASALMQRLSAEPGLVDVRTPVAVVRANPAGREQFSIEIQLDPKVLGPGKLLGGASVSTAPAPLGAVSPAAAAASGAPPAGVPAAAVATAPAVPAKPIVLPPPGTPSVSVGGFTIGGGSPPPAQPASGKTK